MKRRIVSLDQRVDDEINGRLDQPHLRDIGPHELVVGRLADLISSFNNNIKSTVDDGQRTCLPINRVRSLDDTKQRVDPGERYVGWAPIEYVAAAEACRKLPFGQSDKDVLERTALAG